MNTEAVIINSIDTRIPDQQLHLDDAEYLDKSIASPLVQVRTTRNGAERRDELFK
jgi:hypothetical protein